MVLLLQYTLTFASVLILVALGGCFSEHSGVINLGLEGVMIMGALGGALAMRYMPTGSSAFAMLIVVLLAAALAWLFAESVLQARPISALTKALRTALPLAVLAGVCYNFCVYFAAEPQLMGQNPALYENVSRLVQFWL